MPAVSTGGAPLPAIGPSAAAASRPPNSIDGAFAALLAPIAAELGKVSSKPAQPGTFVAQTRPPEPNNQAPDQAKVAIQPVESAVAGVPANAGDSAKVQTSTSLNLPGQIGGLAVPDLATTPESLISVPPGSGAPGPRNAAQTAAAVVSQPIHPQAAPVASTSAGVDAADKVPQPTNANSSAGGVIKDAAPVNAEGTATSDSQLAAKPSSRVKADNQESSAALAGMVPVANPLLKPADAKLQQPVAADPSGTASTVIPASSATSVEVGTETPASERPQVGAANAPRGTSTATVAEVTVSQHAPARPQLNATNAAPTHSPATAADAKLQLDAVQSAPLNLAGTGATVTADPNVMALVQPDAASSLASNAVVHRPATPQSATVTSVGTVAALPADPRNAALPPESASNPHQDIASVSALPAGNGITPPSLPQSQTHDARSDPVTSPLFTAGVATAPTPNDTQMVPPSGLPFAPPTGTATQQIAIHVAQSLNDGGKTVTVELHPAELGRVEIHFSFHADGMNVRLTVDRPETFDAFSHDRSGLAQQLAQAGVDLGSGGIDLRLGQQQPDQTGSYFGGRTPRATMPTPQPEAVPATLWVSDSLLDILA